MSEVLGSIAAGDCRTRPRALMARMPSTPRVAAELAAERAHVVELRDRMGEIDPFPLRLDLPERA